MKKISNESPLFSYVSSFVTESSYFTLLLIQNDWFMNLIKLTDYSLLPLCQNNNVSNPVKLCTQVFFSFQKTKKRSDSAVQEYWLQHQHNQAFTYKPQIARKIFYYKKTELRKCLFLSLINYKIQMYISFKIETSTYVLIMIKPQSVL